MKNFNIAMLLMLVIFMFGYDLKTLNLVNSTILRNKTLVERALKLEKTPGEFIKGVTYTCIEGCEYSKESLVKYVLTQETSFFLTFGRTKVELEFTYYLTPIEFYE